MAREQLSKGLHLRVAPGEMAMLDDLSETTGLPKSAIVRQLIRREHETKFGIRPAKRKPKR